MKSPDISIIVPAYNVEEYLEQCLVSLINQTMVNIEIILINDGSKDNTASLCVKYSEIDKRIIFVQKRNTGLSDSRNMGIDMATGEYIMFVDADDWIDHNTCEVAINHAHKYNSDVVFWPYAKEFSDKTILKESYLDEEVYYFEDVRDKLQRRMIGPLGNELRYPENANILVTAWAKLFRRAVINQIRFIDTSIIGTEDAYFNLQVFNEVKVAVYTKGTLYHHRKSNPGSLTSNYKPEAFCRWQNLHEYMSKFIEEKGLPVNFVTALSNRIALSIIGLGLNEISSTNKKPTRRKIDAIRQILSSPEYVKAYRDLEMKYFKPHWKLFFLACRFKLATLVYVMLRFIEFLRKRILL